MSKYTKERRIRIASFCASGNKREFLTDQTGNRLGSKQTEYRAPTSRFCGKKSQWKKGFVMLQLLDLDDQRKLQAREASDVESLLHKCTSCTSTF